MHSKLGSVTGNASVHRVALISSTKNSSSSLGRAKCDYTPKLPLVLLKITEIYKYSSRAMICFMESILRVKFPCGVISVASPPVCKGQKMITCI